MKKICVTGGAGFIGSALIRYLINTTDICIINIDKLTYAGDLSTLSSIEKSNRYIFYNTDINNFDELSAIFEKHNPDAVMHLAAESHVDKSIEGPFDFIKTNIIGTYKMLEVSRHYWNKLSGIKKSNFRFHHISTDEVYGDLDGTDDLFKETTPYSPSSPYSASKASSDHLVRAWHRTYGLPVLITNCSNNYGPYQFPEKLIPLTIINSIMGKPITVYGSGLQIRDWLYVDDHVSALKEVLLKGMVGETYNIGGHNEHANIDVIFTICDELEKLYPNKLPTINNYSDLISYVDDRPGHDARYAIDAKKIQQELGWSPQETFRSGIEKTVRWYIDNTEWWNMILKKR